MGARLCCAQKRAIQEEAHGPPEANNDDGSGGFLYEDEEGADIFFSARQSLSQIVGELSYPPTATPKSGRSGNVTVDLPESLLQLFPKHKVQLQDNDHSEAMDKNDEKTVSENSSTSTIRKRPTEILTERLTEVSMIGAGYPGELSHTELEACLEFRHRLNDHIDPIYRAMVYLNVNADIEGDVNGDSDESVEGKGPEEEAFALCRFLRARRFDVDKTFAMMDEHVDLFRKALSKDNLHRSKTLVENHIGCPIPVFSKQFPMLDYGLAKNGAFVVYMKAGRIRLEDGFDCITSAGTPESFVQRYMPMVWYVTCRVFCETMHRLQKERQTDEKGDDFVVLAEAVVVIDLEGLQRELFSKRTMEFMQQSFGVIQCFPEILNRVVVVNVPYFFTFIWSVLKRFIDARTVRKIGFYSSLSSAQKDLLELVDPAQLLLEYGGNEGNPSYDDALEMKLKRDGVFDRYIFERYSKKTKVPPGKSFVTLQTFSLIEKEEAQLTVYTQSELKKVDSNNGTQFLLLPEESNPANGNALENKKNGSKNDVQNRRQTKLSSRFGQAKATTQDQSLVIGPGKFRLVAKKSEGGPIIEKALLVISIIQYEEDPN